MERKDINPKDYVNIDESNFNYELLRQANLVQSLTEVIAEAERDLMRRRENYKDLVRAELGDKIRSDPAKYGCGKATVAEVEAAIVQQPEYRIAFEEFINAEYEVTVLRGLDRALDHKKFSLEQLSWREGKGLYSEPNVSSERRTDTSTQARKEQEEYLNREEKPEGETTRRSRFSGKKD